MVHKQVACSPGLSQLYMYLGSKAQQNLVLHQQVSTQDMNCDIKALQSYTKHHVKVAWQYSHTPSIL